MEKKRKSTRDGYTRVEFVYLILVLFVLVVMVYIIVPPPKSENREKNSSEIGLSENSIDSVEKEEEANEYDNVREVNLGQIKLEELPNNWESIPYQSKVPSEMLKDIEWLDEDHSRELIYKFDNNLKLSIHYSIMDEEYPSILVNDNYVCNLKDWTLYKTENNTFVLITDGDYEGLPTEEKYNLVEFNNNGDILSKDSFYIDLIGSGLEEQDETYVINGVNATIVRNGNNFKIIRRGKVLSETTFNDIADDYEFLTNYYISSKHVLYYVLLNEDGEKVELKFLKVKEGVSECTHRYAQASTEIGTNWPIFKKDDGQLAVYSMDEETYLRESVVYNNGRVANELDSNHKYEIKENILDKPNEFELKYYTINNGFGVESNECSIIFWYEDVHIEHHLLGFDDVITRELSIEDIDKFNNKRYDIDELEKVLDDMKEVYEKYAKYHYDNYLLF